MTKVLLVDCSPWINEDIEKFLEGKEELEAASYERNMVLNEYRLVLLEAGEDQEATLDKLVGLRYGCNFRDVPIILLQTKTTPYATQRYISAGATDVLIVKDSLDTCHKILQSF